jgi:hypothetical protein
VGGAILYFLGEKEHNDDSKDCVLVREIMNENYGNLQRYEISDSYYCWQTFGSSSTTTTTTTTTTTSTSHKWKVFELQKGLTVQKCSL